MNFVFIIGMRKAGTGALYKWIIKDRKVRGSDRKESYYFVDKESPFYRVGYNFHEDGLRGFSSIFPEDGKIYIDATTHHFYQKTAKAVIPNIDKKAVVICVRDPIERLISSFNYAKYVMGKVRKTYNINNYFTDVLRGNYKRIKKNTSSRRQKLEMTKEPIFSEYEKWIYEWKELLTGEGPIVVPMKEIKKSNQKIIEKISDKIDYNISPSVKESPEYNSFYKPKSMYLHKRLKSLSFYFPKYIRERAKRMYINYMSKEDITKERPKKKILKELRFIYADSIEYYKRICNAWA